MILLPALLALAAAAILLAVVIVVRRRHADQRRAHDALQVAARRQARQLQRGAVEHAFAEDCAHAATEDDVVALLDDALRSLDANRPYELHLVDATEPVLRLVFATGETPRRPPADASPFGPLATRLAPTLVYRSTDTDDLCPHLATRLVEHCSAVAVPLLAADRLVGLLYAMGPDGQEPSRAVVATYEQLARTAAAAIAAIRGLERPRPTARTAMAAASIVAALEDADDLDDADDGDLLDLTDPLRHVDGTPLARRAEAERVIDALVEARTPFALLLFDIDGFGNYHARHGAAVGDEALRAIAHGSSRALGGAGLFRLDGDHLLVVLADARSTHALRLVDELRGEIAREVDTRRLPAPTVSFGVVEAATGTDAARVLDAAHEALYNARARGNAATVLGLDTPRLA